MINLVVALRCEAVPLIDHYKLVRRSDCRAYDCYSNAKSEIHLVITRPGKMNAAAATAWLAAMQADGSEQSAWLNVGIAGHRCHEPGEVLVASKIVDNASQYRFYPYMHQFEQSGSDTVYTVDEPEEHFTREALYDMEASGFYTAAMRFSTVELAQCLKIVSDNRQHSADRLNEQVVTDLVKSSIPVVSGVIDALNEMAVQAQKIYQLPALYDEWCQTLRFSQTQAGELANLVRQFIALDDFAWLTGLAEQGRINPSRQDAARELLQAMRARIEELGRVEL